MRPKIVFLDIDGTILPFGEARVHPAVCEGLTLLHDAGVRLFVATGRAPFSLPDLSGIPFDGMLCFNGSYCFDQSGVIHAQPLGRNEICAVIANAERLGFSVLAASAKHQGSRKNQRNLDEYVGFARTTYAHVDDYEELIEEGVFQLMIGATPDYDERLIENVPNVRTARWWDRAVDVIPQNCGKAKGIARVLEHYGFQRHEAAAFGDGGNDRDMIEYVGMGIAMGGADEKTRSIADYVTDTCEDDGVLTAIRHFGWI